MVDRAGRFRTPTIAESVEADRGRQHVPVTFASHAHVAGPFFHGTMATLAVGDRVEAGWPSNHQEGRIANHVYFTSLLEPAVWAAELTGARTGTPGRGRIYVVEPTGPFEDDPNVTDRKFPGNPTRSYRTRHPMVVVEEVEDWEGHDPAVQQAMLDGLQRLREQGLDVIDD